MNPIKHILAILKLIALCVTIFAALIFAGWHFGTASTETVEPLQEIATKKVVDTEIKAEEPVAPTIAKADLPATEYEWEKLPAPPAPQTKAPATETSVPNEPQREVVITDKEETLHHLQRMRINGVGPKGITVNSDGFIAWGDTIDVLGNVTLLRKEGDMLYFEAFGQHFSRRF